MRRKILLCTIGTLGDLHPFIAVGQALQRLGYDPLLCVNASHLEKVKKAGLRAHAIMPSFEEIGTELGLSEEEAVARIMSDQDYMIREVVLHWLAESAKAIETAADGAEAIIGSLFALGGPIIAEKRCIPFVPAILQPMTTFSSYDPPIKQGFGTISSPQNGPAARAWNSLCFAVIRLELRRRYAAAINSVRHDHGLTARSTTPILEPETYRPLRLAFYPSILAPSQPDFPRNYRHVGFPVFDEADDLAERLDSELEDFLAAGPPPLIFTLGSLATSAPGRFFEASLDAARALNMRAIFLTGDEKAVSTREFLFRKYIPHALLFPRAAAVVHHGGIGTTAQAILAGKPQLIVPQMVGDQWDNGSRVVRLGVARMIGARRYTAWRASKLLDALLSQQQFGQRATALAELVSLNNGADAAAEAIDKILAGSPGISDPASSEAASGHDRVQQDASARNYETANRQGRVSFMT
ncbi:MAG: glycosyltransferase family 1 protein [Sphingomonadales bacterium]|nr:glycosyltransferase family 1 protein [Sphingomonadales bacterium]MDE2570769.1 glycosyltransferase family 1 protein [Sphingomonadales bacterium]